jgi:HEAT repeat protein
MRLFLIAVTSSCLCFATGCGKGNVARLPEMNAPPKPTADAISKIRERTFGAEVAPRPQPLIQAPTFTPLPYFREWGVRQTATDSLARIGLPALPELIVALKDPHADVRDRAAQALARIGPPASQAVPALVDALRDPDWRVRRSAARALGQIGPAAEAAVPALIDVIRDPASDQGAPADAEVAPG